MPDDKFVSLASLEEEAIRRHFTLPQNREEFWVIVYSAIICLTERTSQEQWRIARTRSKIWLSHHYVVVNSHLRTYGWKGRIHDIPTEFFER